MTGYTEAELQVIWMVFGDEGRALALQVQPIASDMNRTQVPTEPGETAAIEHTPERNTWTVIHEFAHYYCAVKKRELLASATEDQAEACACLAEMLIALAFGMKQDAAGIWLLARANLFKPWVLAMAFSAVQSTRGLDPKSPQCDTPYLIEQILKGRYGT